jgi:hypothetical protein
MTDAIRGVSSTLPFRIKKPDRGYRLLSENRKNLRQFEQSSYIEHGV